MGHDHGFLKLRTIAITIMHQNVDARRFDFHAIADAAAFVMSSQEAASDSATALLLMSSDGSDGRSRVKSRAEGHAGVNASGASYGSWYVLALQAQRISR